MKIKFLFGLVIFYLFSSCEDDSSEKGKNTPSIDPAIFTISDAGMMPGLSDDPDHPVLLNEVITNDYPDLDTCALQDAYDFRDDFLSNYPNGVTYINRHYKIARYKFENQIIKDNFWKSINFAKASFEAANTLQNGSDDEIVISDDYYNQAIEMMNLYRNYLSDTSSILLTIDSIETDISLLKGKERSEVIDFLGE